MSVTSAFSVSSRHVFYGDTVIIILGVFVFVRGVDFPGGGECSDTVRVRFTDTCASLVKVRRPGGSGPLLRFEPLLL